MSLSTTSSSAKSPGHYNFSYVLPIDNIPGQCPDLTKLKFYLQDGSLPARRQSQQLMSRLMDEGLATLHHFHTMLHWCNTSGEQRSMIEKDLSIAGVEPTAETYAILAESLVVEGDEIAARQLLEKELSNVGLTEHEDASIVRVALAIDSRVLDELRYTRLRRWYKIHSESKGRPGVATGRSGVSSVKELALQFFEKICDSPSAGHYEIMMKFIELSDARLELLQDAAVTCGGLNQITRTMVCLVLEQLVLEGEISRVQYIVEQGEILSSQNVEVGGSDEIVRGKDGRDAWKVLAQATAFYKDELTLLHVPLEYIMSLAQRPPPLSGASKTSSHAGVPKRGKLVRNEEVLLSKLRASFLERKLSAGRIDNEARQCGVEFFRRLKHNSAADEHTFSIFLKHINAAHLDDGRTPSMEMWHVIEEDMPAAGVEPTTAHFNLLVSQLLREGKNGEADRVVEQEMPKRGLAPDLMTSRALSSGRKMKKNTTAKKAIIVETPEERKARVEREVDKLITWI